MYAAGIPGYNGRPLSGSASWHRDLLVTLKSKRGWVGGYHKNFRPLGLCALALLSARTAWFQTSPRNPSGIPTKTCWLFFCSQFLSPFLSNLVLLTSSNLVPCRGNKQPCAFDLKQPCARGVPLSTSVRSDMPLGSLCVCLSAHKSS